MPTDNIVFLSSEGEPTPPVSPNSEESTAGDADAGADKRVRLMVFTCDICGNNPLENIRYHCQSCDDFDLCEFCYNQKRHNAHVCLPIPIPRRDHRLKPIDAPDAFFSPPSAAGASAALVSATSHRSRRSVTVTLDPMERMEQILTRNHLRIRTSHYSSNAVQLFLDIYDQSFPGQKARSKAVDQLILRTALVLVGSLAKRTQSLLKVPLPLEPLQEVEQIFVSQLQRTDPGLHALLVPFQNSLISNAIELHVFLNELVALLSTFSIDKEKSACKLGLRAIEEFRDACGLPSGFEKDFSTVKEVGEVLRQKQASRKKSLARDNPSLELNTEKESKSPDASTREDAEEVMSSSQKTTLIVEEEIKLSDSKNVTPLISLEQPSVSDSKIVVLKNSAATPFETISDSEIVHESEESKELRKMIVLLKEELQDAHARLDVLAFLLKEKVAMPLLRGIERIGKINKE